MKPAGMLVLASAGARALNSAQCPERTEAVAPVEDHALVQDDWLVQAVLLDVGDERLELLALHQGEIFGERVERDRDTHRTASAPEPSCSDVGLTTGES